MSEPLLCRMFGHRWREQVVNRYEPGQWVRPTEVRLIRRCSRCDANHVLSRNEARHD